MADAFETDFVSEYEPQFWGFDTQEEWAAALEEMAKEADERFYIELVKHLKGEASDIEPGTIGMLEAKIAEKLVAEDPELLLPINKDKLLAAIESIYDSDHVTKVTLGAQDIAFARMLDTHEDDLPCA